MLERERERAKESGARSIPLADREACSPVVVQVPHAKWNAYSPAIFTTGEVFFLFASESPAAIALFLLVLVSCPLLCLGISDRNV